MVTVAYAGSGADAGRDDAIAVVLVADLLGALADVLVLRRAHAITGQGRSGALRGRCPVSVHAEWRAEARGHGHIADGVAADDIDRRHSPKSEVI